MPEHGERKVDTKYLYKVQNCINDLKKVMKYAKANYSEISIWACSMGAYFSLLAYKEEKIKKCLFLSPVVNMKTIIENMMLWSNTTEKDLKKNKDNMQDENIIKNFANNFNCKLSVLENGEHYFHTFVKMQNGINIIK